MQCPLQWILKDRAEGPSLQDQSGCILGDHLYIHGGLSLSRTSVKAATNCLFRIQIAPVIGEWMEMTTSESPSLSQHACIGFMNKYIVFVGGWTGQARIPGVHVYDTHSNKWLPPALCEPLLKGFPQGAGLSAHTITEMKPSGSRNNFAAFVIGREGSLRMQRRSGNIYLLYGSLPNSNEASSSSSPNFTYYEANPGLSASSRSYHTTTALAPNVLVNIGGRSDRPVELLTWTRSKDRNNPDWPGDLLYQRQRCPLVSSLIQDLRANKLPSARVSSSNQSCSRGHCAISGEDGVLVTGGESFNALVRDPMDSAYLYQYNSAEKKGMLYNIGKISHPRAYAVYGVHEATGTAWLYGGIGPGGKPQNSLLKLDRIETTE